jgi:ribosome-binding protein aMBF1 (putative translation factor)
MAVKKELNNHPEKVIKAAMAAKDLSYTKLAKKLGRSTTTIRRTIKKESTIRSKRLEDEILEVLEPELSVIHEAFYSNNILKGQVLSPDVKAHMACNN